MDPILARHGGKSQSRFWRLRRAGGWKRGGGKENEPRAAAPARRSARAALPGIVPGPRSVIIGSLVLSSGSALVRSLSGLLE